MKIQSILKLQEGSLDGYYLAQRAADLWHKDNPDKPRDHFWRIGVDVQDKYTEKAGGIKGAYQGKGVSNWTTESLESLAEHVKRQVPLCDSIFRYQSEAYFDTFKTAKKLREAGKPGYEIIPTPASAINRGVKKVSDNAVDTPLHSLLDLPLSSFAP